jgi:hypothetical protein
LYKCLSWTGHGFLCYRFSSSTLPCHGGGG